MAKKKSKKRKKAKKAKVTSPAEPAKVTAYPSAGKKITEFEEKLDQQLAGDEPKRGPGRPRKEIEPEPEFAMAENLIAEAIKTPFELWALSQKLDELKLKDKEAAALAMPVKQILDYYLPNVPMIVLAWASLALTTKSIMAPRLVLIAEIKKQRRPSTAKSADSKDDGQGGPRPPATPPGPGDANKFPTEIKTTSI